MTIPDYVKALLATLLWREESADGLQGMTAVGLVVRNRVMAGWNGGDWCAVMEAHQKFSGTTDLVDTIRWPDVRDPRFQAVLLKVDSIYDGTAPDITNGALYYANLAFANSQWFLTNIVQNPAHPRLGTVGQQTFFA